jgi:hypothetical protein
VPHGRMTLNADLVGWIVIPSNGRNRRNLAVRHEIGEGRQSTPSRPFALMWLGLKT